MKNLREILNKINTVSILCIGDIMLDHYIYGSATRLSPEAPVPIVLVKKHSIIPGGCGNVIKNLSSLKAKTTAICVVGDDYNATKLSNLFTEIGWETPIFIRDPQRPTIVKTRILAGIQQLLRYDEETILPIENNTKKELLKHIKENLPKVDAVSMSDYGKGVLDKEICQEIISLANQHNIPIVADPKGKDYSKYEGATLVTPNRQELAEACGEDIANATKDVQAKAGYNLMNKFNIKNLLITRSEEGMMLLKGAKINQAIILPSRAVEVFDVSGAGDTVVALMALGMATKASLIDCATLANVAAGLVIGKLGTASATVTEIEKALSDYENSC